MLASVSWAQVLIIIGPTFTALTALLRFAVQAVKQVQLLLDAVDTMRVQLARTRQEVQKMNLVGTKPMQEMQDQLSKGYQPVKEIAQKVEEVKEKVEHTNGGVTT